MLLLVGTKLQGIITKMCLDSNDKSHIVRGTLLVRPSDHFFWLGNPKLLLYLIHFILFQVKKKKNYLFVYFVFLIKHYVIVCVCVCVFCGGLWWITGGVCIILF